MPTIKLPNGRLKVFPYNAVGKAQANAFMKMSGGKIKNNLKAEGQECDRALLKATATAPEA